MTELDAGMVSFARFVPKEMRVEVWEMDDECVRACLTMGPGMCRQVDATDTWVMDRSFAFSIREENGKWVASGHDQDTGKCWWPEPLGVRFGDEGGREKAFKIATFRLAAWAVMEFPPVEGDAS
jgi:hypothetical protein